MNHPDFGWLTEHSADVAEEYAGKWIAVYAGRVVASGDTAVEASEKAKREVGDVDFILEAIDRDTDVIYGCS